MLTKALNISYRICASGPSVSGHKQLFKNIVCLNSSDATSNGTDKNEGEQSSKIVKKNAKTVDIIGKEMFKAVKDVADELHKDDENMKKETRRALIDRLAQSEKETFDAATASQNNEMLSDDVVVQILADVNALKPKRASQLIKEGDVEKKMATYNIEIAEVFNLKALRSFCITMTSCRVTIFSAAEVRHARRGLVLLRREIFYQAHQSGYTPMQAREISERAVKLAEARAIAKSRKELETHMEEEKKEEAKLAALDEKERTLYNYAFEMAEKMLEVSSSLKPEKTATGSTNIVNPLLFHPSVFAGKNGNLGIFSRETLPKMQDHHLKEWKDLDEHAARVWNQLFGPKNGFEEYIEWTKKGKMWPYPINNEYLLGDEEKVSFHEHIFLNKELEQYKLPKTGPVAHFMELVCVGLSKNSYMTVQKKRDHLKWCFFTVVFIIVFSAKFANFFDAKRVEEINHLHKAEQEALN
uniref:Small ribosomal subunit protein mS31 n=1 Tax=Syphacia muris TaxID=451379 RepID=A0A0N5AB46_9BILA